MDFVVLGGGGIGSVVAAFLAQAGHDVRLVTRGEHLAAIRADGLRVSGLADFTADVAAATEALGDCDVLVVATKTFDTRTAHAAVDGLRPRSTFSLQNGVQKNNVLGKAFGRDAVLGAATMVGATRTGPGAVDYTMDGPTMIGELEAAISPRVNAIEQHWRAAGLVMRVVDDILAHEWAKQALQAGIAPLAALTQLPTCQIFGQRPLATSLVSMMREVAAVAAASGIELTSYDGYGFDMHQMINEPFADAVQRLVDRGAELQAAGKTNVIVSMSQDIRAGRRTEIDETVGYVVGEAHRLGVTVPLLEFVHDTVLGIELASGARDMTQREAR
jgi:2-dehydropantoate 2-reductase